MLMTDAVTSVFFPWFTLIRFYPKIDLVLTPLLLAVNSFTVAASFKEDNESMACFHNPGYIASLMNFRLNTHLLIVIYASFSNRKTELNLFFEQR